jgi:hypothetical protein
MSGNSITGAGDAPIWGEEFIKRYILVADQESHDSPRMIDQRIEEEAE